jgi:hypothetical protein
MTVGNVYGQKGKAHLRSSMAGYNAAAERWPWAVLVDLDESHECPSDLRRDWLETEAEFLCFRIAVRQVEAWILADVPGAAKFLGVKRSLFPQNPDSEDDAKRTLIGIAEQSRLQHIREAIVPSETGRRSVGPLYNATVGSFVGAKWSPEAAAAQSESFRRCMIGLERLRSTWDETSRP